ncbi:Alpha/beta hydrolase family protein [Stieleria bergensis]|uniref:Alpha/beta hydrolase family protein n=1 Tax=Stieleria bergensis TaxID=2528025 RepID=A0A517STI3_9BACT|nr:Alpha/beta hydrolase family protein [Planctomycetes bacterium SV_7m_r]
MTAIQSVLFLLLLAPDPLGPGDHTRTLTVGNIERSYIVHVPPNYDHDKSSPVVLVFHGGGANPQSMIRFSGMNAKSDEAGFIAVYPAGTGRFEKLLTFNGGNCCGYAMRNKVDDVEFTSQLLDDLATVVNVDEKRVFATGMSNGGIITYRLASELSERIAAIAPVGGPMGTQTCNPKRPVPVIHFHGTDDENAPFKGGKGKGVSGTDFYSVEHSINAWVKANGCNEEPVVTKQQPKIDDGTSIIRKTYGDGKDGAEVVLIEIVGGGHTWPGGPSRVRFLGKTTKNISANDAMWKFFQKHPMN